jgi:hypothetical protein
MNEDVIKFTDSAFYVGQASYALAEGVMIVVFIGLLIFLVFIYRKPVKNVGKPKGRR